MGGTNSAAPGPCGPPGPGWQCHGPCLNQPLSSFFALSPLPLPPTSPQMPDTVTSFATRGMHTAGWPSVV